MCTYIIFSSRRYIAQTATQQVSNFVRVVQKRLGMNKFVHTKSPTGRKFSKNFSSAFVYRMDCSCAMCTYICGFLCGVRWRHNRAPNLEQRLFCSISYKFEEGQRRQLCINLDTVFDICYGIRCSLQRTKQFAYPSVGGATGFAKLRSRFCKA